MFNHGISIVLPAYNEEKNIGSMVEQCLKYLSSNFTDYEIVIVDDGSKDLTGRIADRLAEQQKNIIRVFHHHPNQGYGAALRTGLTNASKELVFYTDSDNQFDIVQISEFIPFVDSYDVLLGYRSPRQDPFYRLIISAGYNLLVSGAFNLRVKDVNSSFKLFHREVFKSIDIKSNEFFVDAEIIAKVRHHNLSILERPVKHFSRPTGNTTVNFRHVVTTLKEMLGVFVELKLKNAQTKQS